MADKPLVILHGDIKTTPLSAEARGEAGVLLRLLQRGRLLSMPFSRPMPSIAARCHELRIIDTEKRVTWRIVYRIDPNAILVAEVFSKKSRGTPKDVIENCRRRFAKFDADTKRRRNESQSESQI